MQQNNGLDKSQIISFAVLCLVLFGFMFYFQNKQSKEEQIKAEQQNRAGKNAVKPSQANNINPNVTPNAIQTANLSNKELKVEFNSLGGQVSKVELAEYKAYDHKTDKADLQLYLITKIIRITVFSLKIKQEK